MIRWRSPFSVQQNGTVWSSSLKKALCSWRKILTYWVMWLNGSVLHLLKEKHSSDHLISQQKQCCCRQKLPTLWQSWFTEKEEPFYNWKQLPVILDNSRFTGTLSVAVLTTFTVVWYVTHMSCLDCLFRCLSGASQHKGCRKSKAGVSLTVPPLDCFITHDISRLTSAVSGSAICYSCLMYWTALRTEEQKTRKAIGLGMLLLFLSLGCHCFLCLVVQTQRCLLSARSEYTLVAVW